MEAAELAAELAQFDRAFGGGHDVGETDEDIGRIERAIKTARQK